MVTYAFLISAFALVLVGIFGILTRKNIIRILLAINIIETGVNLLIVALGYEPGGAAPIITRAFTAQSMHFVDPLPQALVLTSIVIGLGTTALALTITLRYFRGRRMLELDTDEEDLAGRDGLSAQSADGAETDGISAASASARELETSGAKEPRS